MTIQCKESVCEIWVSYSEKTSYRTQPAFQDAVLHAQTHGLQTCVYVGGAAPLLQNIADLLEEQPAALSVS